ncbi:Hypothetical protein ORPV_1011 [Orpheovirus IHUMI-LCC2]|uniref:Uncharacterized protein n=1 Tax=Orpheovirus IHUMI-LCC2 TaxID=2023057 RepID=A0A2I2L5T5_9VIRU|nr:Hypothetical protein ORPV_1011 [Orpheovirus IHUMI-LCC2]SNW62915.1 Hypothetical protein ORPV_1011 [Orpheovirus IHUMI-LCC2]
MDQQLFEKLLGGFVGINNNNTQKENKAPSGEDILRQLVSGFMSPHLAKEENKKSPQECSDLIANMTTQQSPVATVPVPTPVPTTKLLNNMNSEEKCVTPQYTWNIHYPNAHNENEDEQQEDDEEEDIQYEEEETERDSNGNEGDEFVKLLRETTKNAKEQKNEKLRKAIEETKTKMMDVARKGVYYMTLDLSEHEEWVVSAIEDYVHGLGISCKLYDNRLSLDWSE